MKTICIDNDFACYPAGTADMREVDVELYLDDCTDEHLSELRFVPAGESWTRPDGVVFHGEMLSRR